MKKQHLPNRSFLTNFAMQIFFLIFLFVSSILPQAIINERVEINPDKQSVGADFMVLNNSSLVMLKTGLLKVYYLLVKHYNVELPDYSLLKVNFLKNNVLISDSVKPHFPNFNWWTDYMYNHCSQQYEWREGYNFVAGVYIDLASVVEGDTVQFKYYSDNVETQQPIEYDIYSATQNGTAWNVKFGNYNNCLLDFDHLLMVSFYVYDEVETIYADIDPGVLYPGDSAQVVIKRRLPGGILEDYPPEQTFEVGMLEGCMLGNLLVDDSLDTYFYDVSQPIKFIADTTGDSSGVVLLSIGLVDTSVTTKSNKISAALTQYCFDGEPINEDVTTSTEVKEEPTILLGETKYYQARYKTVDELIIEEAPVDANGVPHLNGGLAENVWGDNPVGVIDTCSNCGQKMGVYWEKKYPVPNQWVNYTVTIKKVTKTFKIVKMDPLQTGLIRLIGRYWTPDSTYLITLKAKRENGDSGQIQIKVIEPPQLKSEGQSPSYSKAKDVLNHPFNVDSLCILLGGKYGIPPQLIKGQMLKEAATKNFGDSIGIGFAPSYRYEPYTVQFWSSIKNNSEYNKFYIKDSTYSFNSVPYHNHVLYHDYFRNIKTVWNIIEDQSRLVNSSNSDTTYGRRVNNFMNFSPYTDTSIGVQQKYNDFKDYYIQKYQSQLTMTEIADSTNERMIKYFKKEWKNKGAENIIAQTRAASSYGLLQMLYTTARGREYPNDTIPENINLLKYLELFLKTQKKYLQDGLGINVESGNNWTDGFEYSLSTKIYVPNWNTISTYAKGVYTNSKIFLPKKSLE